MKEELLTKQKIDRAAVIGSHAVIKERPIVFSEHIWEYIRPTVLIESQSAPILKGNPAEQAYMRAFPLTTPKDLVVTDFSLNSCYINQYLIDTLGFDLPKRIVVNNHNRGSLSENLINDQVALGQIQDWASNQTGDFNIQFFNVTESEKKLAETLGIKASCGDIEKAMDIGSKTGFRRMSEEIGIPMPEGYICSDESTTQRAVEKLFKDKKNVLIKSEYGTGGTELKSNVLLSLEEWEGSESSLQDFVTEKLKLFNGFLGDEWVVEEVIQGDDGSVHAYIHDEQNAIPSFTLGSITEDNTYVGGYWPFESSTQTDKMTSIVDKKIVPYLQKNGVFGYHCFDFKDGKFLEDNARQGAIDFIHGIVARTAEIHFPNQKYAYWHEHIPIKIVTTFDEVWEKIGPLLIPPKDFGVPFAIVTNPEVLRFGRSLDLTAVSIGQTSSLEAARAYFKKMDNLIKSIL